MNRALLFASVASTVLSALCVIDAPPATARVVARTIRFEGYLEVAPDGVRPQAKWSVDVGKKSVVLQVTRIQIIAGPGTPSDVIQALKPYRAAAFKIVGDEQQLAKLAAAGAGSKVELQGILRLSPARTLLLSTVQVHEKAKD